MAKPLRTVLWHVASQRQVERGSSLRFGRLHEDRSKTWLPTIVWQCALLNGRYIVLAAQIGGP